jgi:hypothetical protein
VVGLAARAAPSSAWEYPESGTTLELLAARGIFPDIENPRSVKDRYKFLCPLPGHANDTHPSFSVHADGVRWKCFPCGEGGGPGKLIELLGGGSTARQPKPPKLLKKPAKEAEEPLQGCTLAQLAEAKGLPIKHLQDLGWYDSEWKYKLSGHWTTCPSVAMPYPHSVQHRVGLTDKKNRFRWQVGSEASAKELYGAEWLRAIDKTVLVVEGTTDVAAALLLGVPVVGLPGTGTWSRKTGPTWAKELEGRNVVLWQEPGEAGQKLADAIAQDIPDLRVIQPPPGIKDVVELLDQAGDGAGDMLRDLIGEAEPYYQPHPGKADVGNKERENKGSFLITDIRSQSQLWEAMKAYFPLRPGMKPRTVARPMYNHSDGKGLIADFPSNGWGNPGNAQLKRQRLGFNMLPRMNGPQVYALRLPFDDWDPQAHEAISRRISRAIEKAGDGADYGWAWFNNALDRGYYLYLTSAPGVSGFEPVEGDIEPVLIDALKAIHPPGKEEPGRFRPYGGSDNWTARVEGTGEEDRDKWQIVAASDKPADFVQVEAECVAAGIRYEYTKPYWRQQIGTGLEMKMPFEEFMELCSSLGYSPTRAGRAGLADSGEEAKGSAEGIKAVAATLDSPDPEGQGERWEVVI